MTGSFQKYVAPSLSALVMMSCANTSSEPIGSGDFVLASTTFTPDGASSLVRFVDDPTVPVSLDPTVGLEIGGAAALFGEDRKHAFAIGSSESPTLTRYDVSKEGELTVSGEPMSLAAYGLTSAFKRPGLVPFISSTKAYFLDERNQQAIVFDPTAMTITGTISLASAERTDLTLEFGERAVVRGNYVFIPTRYRTADDGEAGLAAAIVLDTRDDSVVGVATDSRCGDTVHIVERQDGLYFGTGTIGALFHTRQFPAGYPAPCVLRIEDGETTFDPDYHVALSDLVGGREAGRLVAGVDGNVFVLALHTELLDAPITESTPLWDPWEASAWRFWSVSLDGGAGEGTLVESAAPAGAGGWSIHAGGHDYVSRIDYDFGKTTLYVTDEDNALVAGLEVTGVPYGLVRVR